jgi:hypothetical protein
MANLFFNLPLPVGPGVGAAVNVAALGRVKTVTMDGNLQGSLVVEYATDTLGTNFVPLVTFVVPGKRTFEVAATFMRVRVTSFASGTANVDVAGTDDGTQRVTLPAPAGNGLGGAINVSALGTFNTIVVAGAYTGVVVIQISEDGIDFVDVATFFGTADGESILLTAQFMRVQRQNVNPSAPGLPIIDVCAVNDPTPGIIVISAPVTCFVYRPGGVAAGNVYTSWPAVVAAMAAVEGCKMLEFDDSIVSPAPVPAGAWTMNGVTWTGARVSETDVTQVQIADGASFTGLRRFSGFLLVEFLGSAPAVADLADDDAVYFEHVIGIQCAGTAPMFLVSAVNNVLFEFWDRVLWINAGNEVLEVAAGGSAFLRLGNDVSVGLNAIESAVGTTVEVVFTGASAAIVDQATLLGTLSVINEQIDRIDVGSVDPGPVVAALLDTINRVDPSGGAVTVNLPAITALNIGRELIVKNATDDPTPITVTPAGADTIDGQASVILTSPRQSLWIVSDGVSTWQVVNAEAAATAPATVFVYRPGGVQAGNVYTSWTDLVAALATVEGRKVLEFDDSIVTPAPIPAGGPYDMTDVVWTGTAVSANSRNEVEIADGATFANLRRIEGFLDIDFQGTGGPALDDFVDDDGFILQQALIACSGTAQFFEIGNGVNNVVFELFDEARIDLDAVEVINIDGTGSLFIELNDDAILVGNTVLTAAAATLNIVYIGSGAQGEDQTSGAGTIVFVNEIRDRMDVSAIDAVSPGTALIDTVNRVDPTAGAFTMNLPAITPDLIGRRLIVKNASASANVITITPAGGDTVDGAATITIAVARGSVTLYADGVSNWESV